MDQAIIDRVVSVMGGLDEDKLAVLSSRITRQMVIACAGAGKTRLCKARILVLRILVIRLMSVFRMRAWLGWSRFIPPWIVSSSSC